MFNLFSKKVTEDLSIGTTEDVCLSNKEPRICLFDLSEDINEYLINKGFNCTVSSLGTQINIPNSREQKTHMCYLNHLIPENLHEFQICIFDMKNEKTCKYEPDVLKEIQQKSKEKLVFCSEFPATIFDPRPMAGTIIKNKIREIFQKECLIIVFADKQEVVDYQIATLNSYGVQLTNQIRCSNYEMLPMQYHKDKYGTITKVVSESSLIGQLLNKYAMQMTYQATFHHPTQWDSESKKSIKMKNFIPLLKDVDDEIISYVQFIEEASIFIFPQIFNKKEFLKELLDNVLPSIYPNLFPYSTQFSWLNDIQYSLPNTMCLKKEREVVTKEFEERLKNIEERLKENNLQYKFLHDLLSETGDKLVKAIEIYLKWLGFTKVFNVDELEPEIKEEDLKIELEDGLLVIEVKGIGGTSTDSECSQISKIRFRRCRQRNKLDVKALYIVNHQRYLPPVNRKNPPFNDNQIRDALDDNRGVLSTYQLFELYFLIEDGIVTKEYAKAKLQESGLIDFKPQVTSLGIAEELFKNGHVAILNIAGQKIKVGDEILVCKDGKYMRRAIMCIMINNQKVTEVSDGEVGIELNESVQRKSEFLLPI